MRILATMFTTRELRLPIIALGIGILLMGLKFLGWYLTGSNAILSDALESIVNIVAGSLALYSLWLATQPKDSNHPNGHGKIEFISAGFEGGMIVVAGGLIIFKAVRDSFGDHAPGMLDLGIGITAFSGLVNFIVGAALEKRGQKLKSVTLEANGKHLKSDAYSSLGLIVGLALVFFFDLPWLDNLLAIIFGFVILITGWKLVRRSIAGIMDESDEELLERIAEELEENRQEDWIDVHNLRVIQYGSSLHIDCHLTVPWFYDTRQSHEAMKSFEDRMKDLSERPVELFVHVDPCEPLSCAICPKQDCEKRQTDFKGLLSWDKENLTANRKHNH